MKKMSIRMKITLWFSAALIIVVAMTFFVILSVSNQIIQKTIRDSLIESVEGNVDEIEYYASLKDIDLATDVDYFFPYKDGYLEIDDDFLDAVNQVYSSLCSLDGTFLYGENPIVMYTSDLEFVDGEVRTVSVNGTIYYVFDRELTADGLDGLWLRGVVSEKQGETQMTAIARLSLLIMPSIVMLAVIGGYLIARRALSPIDEIARSASRISGGDDLGLRIELGEGDDELHRLADSFNQMFERLDDAFHTERQFTSDASHELRTPVAVILSQSELALDTDFTLEEYEDAMRVIQRQGQKMTKLINDMLDITRLELKSAQYDVSEFDLSNLTSSVCEDMALIRENNITLEYDVSSGIRFAGNEGLMSRLLTNLISNAYRYGNPDGHIWVSLHEDGRVIRLSVRDDGIGISEQDRKRVFERFYQADSSRSSGGSGLGLSMVREIVRFHGGEIALSSEQCVGSTFTCTFTVSK